MTTAFTQATRQPFLRICLAFLLLLSVSACAPRMKEPPPPSPYASGADQHPYRTAPATGSLRPSPRTEASPSPQTHSAYEEVKVGLLLPLTGKAAPVGKAILDAAMMGVFDKYANPTLVSGAKRITLLPKDTGDDPKQAVKAAEAVIERGATLLIGPLFADSSKAVAEIAKKHRLIMLSLSNNRSVAGENSFIFGFMPEEQVRRVVTYAHEEGLEPMAALLPANDYGDVVETTLQEQAALHNIELAGSAQYAPDAADKAMAAQQLTGTTTAKEPVAIKSLLLAEGGEPLQVMATRLKAYRLGNDKVTYLGTGLMDDNNLIGNKDMQGSLFASSPLKSYRNFATRFEHVNGYTPPRLASLGYDAVTLAAALAERGGFTRESLLAGSGFEGPANGIFRFRPDGTIERALSIIRIEQEGFKELSPAPRMFY